MGMVRMGIIEHGRENCIIMIDLLRNMHLLGMHLVSGELYLFLYPDVGPSVSKLLSGSLPTQTCLSEDICWRKPPAATIYLKFLCPTPISFTSCHAQHYALSPPKFLPQGCLHRDKEAVPLSARHLFQTPFL